jgi:hypothetical protein
MPDEPTSTTCYFVSYSREDENIVAPIVRLLRTAPSEVFFDRDSLKPGDRWSELLGDAISRCSLFVLFWCDHSAQSYWVNREWNAALNQKKKIIPVLLDSTTLPAGLNEFQWLDFRQVCIHNPSQNAVYDGTTPPRPMPSKSMAGWDLLSAALGILVPLILLTANLIYSKIVGRPWSSLSLPEILSINLLLPLTLFCFVILGPRLVEYLAEIFKVVFRHEATAHPADRRDFRAMASLLRYRIDEELREDL